MADVKRDGNWPLLKLGLRMLDVENRFTNSTDQRVLNSSFDPYIQNVVAPDHCLTGIAKGLIQTCFQQLPSDDFRNQLERAVSTSIQELGLSTQSVIYNVRTKRLHSLSMSYIYAIISILPFAIEKLQLPTPAPSLNLIVTLRELVSLTFWWPSKHTDGVEAFELVHGSKRDEYYRKMRQLAMRYIETLNDFCKKYPGMMKNVDRPNVHRMLELYMHTIVIFGHALFVTEMLLEAAHQPLKASLSRNSSTTAHISAVHHVLLRDWFTRLFDVTKMKKEGNTLSKKDAQMNLRFLFVGTISNKASTAEIIKKLGPELDQHINETLDGPVEAIIEKWYGMYSRMYTSNHGVWEGSGVQKRKDLDNFEREAAEIGTIFLSRMRTNSDSIKLFSKSLYKGEGKGRRYNQHALTSGDVIECFISDGSQNGKVINCDTEGFGARYMFLIYCLLGCHEKEIWAVCSQLELCSGGNRYALKSRDTAELQLIKLKHFVRRVYATNCSPNTNQHQRKLGLKGGGQVFVLRRSDGYPPRQA